MRPTCGPEWSPTRARLRGLTHSTNEKSPENRALSNEADGTRTRNHRIDRTIRTKKCPLPRSRNAVFWPRRPVTPTSHPPVTRQSPVGVPPVRTHFRTHSPSNACSPRGNLSFAPSEFAPAHPARPSTMPPEGEHALRGLTSPNRASRGTHSLTEYRICADVAKRVAFWRDWGSLRIEASPHPRHDHGYG